MQEQELTVESLAGVPDGNVLNSGETVVGSYVDDKLVGFHKLPPKESDKETE